MACYSFINFAYQSSNLIKNFNFEWVTTSAENSRMHQNVFLLISMHEKKINILFTDAGKNHFRARCRQKGTKAESTLF